MSNTENIICDTDNYYNHFDYKKCFQYHEYYVKLICHYIEYLCDHTILQNSKYFIFILMRGIFSLSHIFNLLILYTKNIDLTISHCNKALYYYIEFIGQIADDSHSYLQLNSKDATLFIYKKTIFELNNEHRKNYILSKKDKYFLDTLSTLNNICNELIQLILQKNEFDIQKKKVTMNYILKNIEKIMKKFKYFTYDELKQNAPTALFFINILQHSKIEIETFIIIYELFIKKLKKKKIKEIDLKNKIYHPNHQLHISSFTPAKYINWLFSS